MGALALAVPAAAAGDEFTFTATNGVWGLADNWDGPSGEYPGADDTAIIPSGRTCRVENANQNARVIEVYGTLGLVGKFLHIGDQDDDGTVEATTAIIDGTFYLKSAGAYPGNLRLHGPVTFDGSGTMTGKSDDGYGEGSVARADPFDTTDEMIVGEDFTIIGTIIFQVSIENNGTFTVDDDDDTMKFGLIQQPAPEVGFYRITSDGGPEGVNGKVIVSAGTLRFQQWIRFASDNDWELSGGEIWVEDGAMYNGRTGAVLISGGTLDLDETYRTQGCLRFYSADVEGTSTIELAYGESASFDGTY
jgi:hypothetical protein